ncbi:hypothetical protein [Paenirhodobacter hankyongi]|uniref:hypothetical protein n=1 Tax=Paenirhodobacter hankyongi TaxID=2294033 RepID=UPI001FE44CF7|nr:hypothetical protein [Sinirhodobacter hankyongi]
MAIAPGLRRLAYRRGERPRFAPKWPCPQLDQTCDASLHDALPAAITALPGVTRQAAPFGAPGIGFALDIEGWVEDAKRGMENSLRANHLDIREQYEKQLKDLQEAYGEAMLELRARKKLQALMERDGVRGECAIGPSTAPNN